MIQNSLLTTVESLLRRNKIAFDKKELFFQIQSHPSYPSLHAVTAVLDHFNIENVAASVPVSMDTLEQLPPTFIAQVKTRPGNELALITKKKNKYQITPSADSSKPFAAKDFLEIFTGIVVVVEKEESVKRVQDYSWLNKALWIIPAILFLGLFVLSNPNINTIIFLFLALVGTVFSIAIIKQELGLSTSVGDAFCASVSEKKDCDAVLSSKGAKLGAFKVSDMSIVYFVTLTLGGLLLTDPSSSSDIMYYLSIVALPVTVYSIYYQWLVLKKWCLMCLSIVGILWAQAVLSYFTVGWELAIDVRSLLSFSLVILAVFALWSFIRPKYEQLLKSEKTTLDFYKFKRNFSLFSALLNKEKPIDTHLSSNDILLGNAGANTEITIVTSPFCGHCKPIHTLVEDILHQYHDDVKVLIRFNIITNDQDSEIVRITTRLLELFHTNGASECLKAMSDIYGDMSSEDWLKKWSESTNKEHFLKPLKEGRKWCTANQINFTPHLMINGRAFPEIYERQDLIFFIEELSEQPLVLNEEERTNQLISEMSL